MSTPVHIAAAARLRIKERTSQIQRSLAAIADGRPGDAEPEVDRRIAVYQQREGVTALRAKSLMSSGAEKNWGKTVDFVDVAFLQRGAYAARAVVRIITRDGQGLGTGFMISPRLLLTNNHVIGSKAEAKDLLIEFDYERDLAGRLRQTTRFAFDTTACFITNAQDDLDYTVVAVGKRLSGTGTLASYSFLPISASQDKHALGDHANIIQHPDGRPKEAVLRENQLVSRAKTTLHYVADTEGGSSGSPVFNVLWQVIALHHWGSPHRDRFNVDGSAIPKTVNEGIRISAIVSDLTTKKNSMVEPQRTLLTEALMAGLNPEIVTDAPIETASDAGSGQAVAGVAVASDGTATWTIPLRVSVQLGGLPPVGTRATNSTPRSPSVEIVDSDVDESGEARIEIDPDYSNRSGYNPLFLDGFEIPLPKLVRTARRKAAISKKPAEGRAKHELPYEHFSVVMNAARRLAFFTATNINGLRAKAYDRKTGQITEFHPGADEEDESEASEQWFKDERLDDDQQTPPGFYQKQTTFDSQGNPIANRRTMDHTARLFQQGHLTRRQDPLWGDDDLVVRANGDTFHVTNRSPQVGFFNMGLRKLDAEGKAHPGGTLHWRALEDWSLNNAVVDKARVTVFTGPIFDDRNDIPWDRGLPEMEGFKAPREYWKVVVRVENGQLTATALCADQSPLIDFVPEAADLSEAALARVSFKKVERYHVSIAELEKRTNIDFGAEIRAADNHPGGERRAVNSLEEVLTPRGRTRSSAAKTLRRGRK